MLVVFPEPLAHSQNVTHLSLFNRCYFHRFSLKVAELVPLPSFYEWSTWSIRLVVHSVNKIRVFFDFKYRLTWVVSTLDFVGIDKHQWKEQVEPVNLEWTCPQCFFSHSDLSILYHSVSLNCIDISEFNFRDPDWHVKKRKCKFLIIFVLQAGTCSSCPCFCLYWWYYFLL